MSAMRMLVAAAVLAVGCAQPPPELGAADGVDLEGFRREVVPILEARCAINCHGVAEASYADFMREPSHARAFHFPFDLATGRIPPTPEALRATYQVTRSGGPQASPDGRIEYGERAEFSPLLRVPLATEFGGLPHRGMDIFVGPDDPDYQTLLRWVTREIAAHPRPPQPLSSPAAYFREHVLGVFERNGCFLSSCHGPDAFNDLKLLPPLPRSPQHQEVAQRSSSRMVEHNRLQALGEVTRFANLGGDPRLSRVIVKNLPLREGGVHQRGGNNQFFESLADPDVQRLMTWLKAEREQLSGGLRAGGKPVRAGDLGRLQAIAYIRGPRHAPRPFLETEPFFPGSDVFVLEPGGTPRNLTAPLHPQGPVEIQGLDVRYDGRALLFSMRPSQDEAYRLYEIELDDQLACLKGSFRKLTSGPERLGDGTLVHHLDPTYIPGPDPTDLSHAGVAFASNEAGTYTASQAWAILGEAEAGSPGVLVDEQRTEAPGTYTGRRISFVDGPDRGSWRTIARHLRLDPRGVGARFVLDRPLAHRPDRRTVYVIEGTRATWLPGYDIWRQGRGKARRMTWTSAQERHPTVRTSGEVMFTSVRNIGYQADRPVFNGAIFRVQAGGFDYHIHGGNRSRYPLYADSRELPSGLEIRLALDPRNLWGGGLLILADHGLGINLEPDNPVDNLAHPGGAGAASIQRFLPTQSPLFPETGPQAVTATGLSPGGSFRDPYPLPDGRVLVARAREFLDHLDPTSDPDWNLWLLDPPRSLQTEQGPAAPWSGRALSGGASANWAEYCPRPVMLRLPEKSHTHQKFAERDDDRQPAEDDGVLRMPADTPGVVECFDYPLLQSFLTHFAPVGPRDFRTNGAPDSSLAYVRVVMHVPSQAADVRPVAAGNGDPWATPVSLGIHGRKRIIAEIPLESDGSFYAQVPPNVPLIVQGLNRDRMALHSMDRWFYVHPGEKLTFSIPRSIFPLRCAGCHGALTGQRGDALGPPDLVSASSRVMANWDLMRAERRPPVSQVPAPGLDFRADVQPLLDRHCVSCHGEKKAAGLDLRGLPSEHYTVAYESLHRLEDPASHDPARKRYVNEREALAVESFLIEKLLGRELQAPRRLIQAGRPHPAANPLSEPEILTLIRWIDLGAVFSRGEGQP